MKTRYILADIADHYIDRAIAFARTVLRNPIRRVLFSIEIGRRR